MALKKLPISQTSLNPDGADFRPSPEMEAEFLKHKHLGFQTPEWMDSIGQKPLMGFGGEGRKMPSLPEVDEEARDKFWAMMMGENNNQKRMLKGGHGVPLSSTSNASCTARGLFTNVSQTT
jgi:saccharopepsin